MLHFSMHSVLCLIRMPLRFCSIHGVARLLIACAEIACLKEFSTQPNKSPTMNYVFCRDFLLFEFAQKRPSRIFEKKKKSCDLNHRENSHFRLLCAAKSCDHEKFRKSTRTITYKLC